MKSCRLHLLLSVGMLSEPFAGRTAEFVVPIRSEFARERLFEKFISTHFFRSAEGFGAFAYFPSVKVYGCEAFVFLKPDGIEMA